MLLKTKAIVLNATRHLGNMLMVRLYTLKSGQQIFITRNEKRKANILLPFSLLEIEYEDKGNRDIKRLNEVNTAFQSQTIYIRPDKSAIALFMAELVLKVVKEEEGNAPLFAFLEAAIMELDLKTTSTETYHLFFLLGLSKFTGFYPMGNYSNLNCFFDLREGEFRETAPPHSFYLEQSNAIALGKLKAAFESGNLSVSISPEQRTSLIIALTDYFRLHLPGMHEINSHTVLHEL